LKAVIYKQNVTLNVRMNDKAAGLTQFGKTLRKTDLLCAVLKVMSCCLTTFSVLMKFPYYYSASLYYWKIFGVQRDISKNLRSSRAACWSALFRVISYTYTHTHTHTHIYAYKAWYVL
jgi:hypothetical protein